ncbi:MAG: hypothetical protein QOH93_1781, partial [Chloroflexia bacterium]|nr:hypothetical protein [Chloroflexia bacterium]
GNASITLPATWKSLSVNINGGTGNLEIFVPQGVETLIDIDTGIGNTTVDSRFAKIAENTYASSGYDTATDKMSVKIDHRVGNLNIMSK